MGAGRFRRSPPNLPTDGNVDLFSFDDDYLRRLRQGDTSVEQHFVAYFSRLLLIKVRRRVRSPEAVEDIRKETFLRVFKALRNEDGIRNAQGLGSFVNSVCNFVLFEHYRASGREQPMDDGFAETPDQTIDLHGAMVTGETKEQVRQVLQSMEAKDREILTAVFLEERDKNEICRQYGIDREYLRVLVHRAKARFRTQSGRIN